MQAPGVGASAGERGQAVAPHTDPGAPGPWDLPDPSRPFGFTHVPVTPSTKGATSQASPASQVEVRFGSNTQGIPVLPRARQAPFEQKRSVAHWRLSTQL